MAETFETTDRRTGRAETWIEIETAEDVTDEILEIAEEVSDSWFPEGKVDWEEFFDTRLEGSWLKDERRLSLGNEYGSPAMKKIQKHIQNYRRYGG